MKRPIYIKQVEIIIDNSMRGLCKKAYPGHKKGCPNFNKRQDCPPKVPLLHKVLDLNHPVFAIWNVYDFKNHTSKMKTKHPEWSKRQVECCLYWQGSARKQLKFKIQSFLESYPGYIILTTPEACGVNITKTMKNIGINLEWPPKTVTYQIALAGKPVK